MNVVAQIQPEVVIFYHAPPTVRVGKYRYNLFRVVKTHGLMPENHFEKCGQRWIGLSAGSLLYDAKFAPF